MLDISFSEIAVIGAVALVVLGPERLPKVARTAGHLFGRLQRYVSGVKADIAREMEASELSKIKQEVQDAAKEFEKTVQQHAGDVEAEAKLIESGVAAKDHAPADPAAVKTDIENIVPVAVNGRENSPNSAPVLALAAVPPAKNTGAYGQGLFDFGIEESPPRVLAARPERLDQPANYST